MALNFNRVQPAAQQPVEPKPVEKKLDPVDELKAFIKTFLDDGKFDESEAELIFQKATELKISEDEAIDLMEAVQNQVNTQPAASQSSDSSVINTLDMLDLIKEGDVRNIKSLFRTWQNAIASIKTDNDQYDAIQCLYYMVFAAVNPEGLIMEQESKKAKLISNYWRIYWAYIAYMKNGREAFAEDMLRKLQTFSEYDENNVSILETLAELNENGEKSALQFYKSRQADDNYSNELLPFTKALKMEIGMTKPTISGFTDYAFITDNLIWWEDEEARTERKARQEFERKRLEQEEAERIAAEQERLRKQITYTIKITEVTNQLNAMFALRKALDWDATEVRENLAILPFKVLVTDKISKVNDLYEQLDGKGLKLQISAVNALGETVKPIFSDASKDNEKTERIQSGSRAPKKVTTVECEFIDLGLSVLWATCNLGAKKPEEFGNYYAWGETDSKQEFSRSNYTADKYSKNILDAAHDPATKLLGEEIKTPTEGDFLELLKKCTIVRDTLNGVKGYKVIGPNGNSVFLPNAGHYTSECGFSNFNFGYWSSEQKSLKKGPAFITQSIIRKEKLYMTLCIDHSESSLLTWSKSDGLPIRPIKRK